MKLEQKLSTGEFVVMAEMTTPKGVDISDFVTQARRLKERVDAVVIPDMDNGVMRMGALAGGGLIRQQGMEPVIHIYGRDRNRMALQGDILAAHVLGIHHFIVVAGEPIPNCDHRGAKEVNDLDEIGILAAVRSLAEGVDLAGFELKGVPEISAGCSISSFVDDSGMEKEIEQAKKKVDAGAAFIVAPAIFDMECCEKFFSALKPLGVPVIATVILLKNVGMARYMLINSPGSRITEDMIRRIRKAPDREAECIKIAAGMVREFRSIAQGVKIATLGWEHRLPDILDQAGL